MSTSSTTRRRYQSTQVPRPLPEPLRTPWPPVHAPGTGTENGDELLRPQQTTTFYSLFRPENLRGLDDLLSFAWLSKVISY